MGLFARLLCRRRKLPRWELSGVTQEHLPAKWMLGDVAPKSKMALPLSLGLMLSLLLGFLERRVDAVAGVTGVVGHTVELIPRVGG